MFASNLTTVCPIHDLAIPRLVLGEAPERMCEGEGHRVGQVKDAILDRFWTRARRDALSLCNHWRALRDSNPCFRRERAMS
jgi:hypothetical protein